MMVSPRVCPSILLLALVPVSGLDPGRPARAAGPEYGPEKGVIATAINPDPRTFPRLTVWLHSRRVAFLAGTFPDVPGLRFDACMYEPSAGFLDLELTGVSLPTDNTLELRHRIRPTPWLAHVTTVTAAPGTVEVVGRLERDPRVAAGRMPERLLPPNLCWGFERGANFAAGGETPALYPRWIARCFIFTDQGRTFLDRLDRPKTNEVPADDPRNNPPWSEHYIGVWQSPKDPRFPVNTSRGRYVIPVIGAVSRDAKYLAALASHSTLYVAQAWHTCLHQVCEWAPPADLPFRRTWRTKLYALPNNPDDLLKRVAGDFPRATLLKDRRVPQ